MFENGFDIDSVIKRLRSDFNVEPHLPFQIRLMLAHLARAEDEQTLRRDLGTACPVRLV